MPNLDFEFGCTLPLCKKWIIRIWSILHYKKLKKKMFYEHSHNTSFNLKILIKTKLINTTKLKNFIFNI